jgi:hypothetical protein
MRFYDTVSLACAPVENFVRARCVAGEVKIVARTEKEEWSADDDARTRGISVGVGGVGGGGGGGGIGGGVGGSAKLADAPALHGYLLPESAAAAKPGTNEFNQPDRVIHATSKEVKTRRDNKSTGGSKG